MPNFYDRHIGPRVVDFACGGPPIRAQRMKVVPEAEGRVLEVGFGSGRNLRFYDPGKVELLFALEPDDHIRKLARRRIAQSPLKIEFLDLPGEEIPLADASVDTVVITFTLCTIPGVAQAVEQMRRVLKPGGRLLFAEHGLGPDDKTRRLQRRVEPYWKPLAGGCHLTRRPPDVLQANGFKVEHQEAWPEAPVMNALLPFATYQYWGSARVS